MSPQCDSFNPGHHVHPIQFFRGHPTPGQPVELLTVTESNQGDLLVAVVTVDGYPIEEWWFHDDPTVRVALVQWQHTRAFLHRYTLVIVGEPGVESRPCLYPCRTPEAWTACSTIASIGSDDPAVLTRALGGVLLRPAARPSRAGPVVRPSGGREHSSWPCSAPAKRH